MLPIQALIPAVLFTALVLAAALQGLAASGHFPRSVKPLGSGPGLVVLFGTIVLTVISFAAGIDAALQLTPWYAAVIGGGLSVLVAPLVLQIFPDRFVDGRGALTVFAGVSLLLTIALMTLAIAAR
jgi:hypothetical protein